MNSARNEIMEDEIKFTFFPLHLIVLNAADYGKQKST